MKKNNIYTAAILSGALLLGSCNSMTNLGKGALIGGGGGAAVGAGTLVSGFWRRLAAN